MPSRGGRWTWARRRRSAGSWWSAISATSGTTDSRSMSRWTARPGPASPTGATTSEPATKDGYPCTFAPRPVRFIRVTMTHNSANTGRHLVEVLAFESRNGSTRCPFGRRSARDATGRLGGWGVTRPGGMRRKDAEAAAEQLAGLVERSSLFSHFPLLNWLPCPEKEIPIILPGQLPAAADPIGSWDRQQLRVGAPRAAASRSTATSLCRGRCGARHHDRGQHVCRCESAAGRRRDLDAHAYL